MKWLESLSRKKCALLAILQPFNHISNAHCSCTYTVADVAAAVAAVMLELLCCTCTHRCCLHAFSNACLPAPRWRIHRFSTPSFCTEICGYVTLAQPVASKPLPLLLCHSLFLHQSKRYLNKTQQLHSRTVIPSSLSVSVDVCMHVVHLRACWSCDYGRRSLACCMLPESLHLLNIHPTRHCTLHACCDLCMPAVKRGAASLACRRWCLHLSWQQCALCNSCLYALQPSSSAACTLSACLQVTVELKLGLPQVSAAPLLAAVQVSVCLIA
jgi:hypothetical protein